MASKRSFSRDGQQQQQQQQVKLHNLLFRLLFWLKSWFTYDVLVPVLLLSELFFSIGIVLKVPYTEIDWKAYMQEVAGVLEFGEFDYLELKGDTGPLVYPAGFVYIYSILYYITGRGASIFTAQLLFVGVYVIFLGIVFSVYRQSGAPAWTLILVCLSRRVHSIFMLRLFNDCFAILFAYVAIWLFLKNRWTLGCFIFSFAVSIKMNVLLFAPGLGILLLKKFGFWATVLEIMLCAIVQVALALPFLACNALHYITRAFDFGRVFLFQWSVNWKFLPEDIFVSKAFAIALLCLQLTAVLLFASKRWSVREGGLWKLFVASPKLSGISAPHIVTVLFTSNFIGIVFSRSLHYQFYVWYYHSLPFLLVSVRVPVVARLLWLLVVELVWNIFPANAITSMILLVCNLCMLTALWMSPLSNEKSKDT